MRAAEAKQFILDRVIVERPDVVDAKEHLLRLGRNLDTRAIAQTRADTLVGVPESEAPLWQNDPTPSLLVMARHLGAQLAVFKAAWELAYNGLLLVSGDRQDFRPSLPWSTVGPSGGGMRATETLEELHCSYLGQLLRPAWLKNETILSEADLYLRTLDANSLHTGIAEALRQAVRTFALGLFVPAVAMLDSASEGAWIEAGHALATKPPTDAAGIKLATSLGNPRASMRAKADSVCSYYESRKDLQARAAVPPPLLRETQLWSGLVRDARNVLHWNVAAAIPNDYAKVSVLLLGALSHIKRLHVVATA